MNITIAILGIIGVTRDFTGPTEYKLKVTHIGF